MARDRPLAFVPLVVLVLIQNIATNAVLIPRYGADGAAVAAAISGLILTGGSIWVVRRFFGRLRLVRAFAAPLAGGLAMTGVVLLMGAPFIVELAVGVLAYAAAFALAEWRAFPDDAALFKRLIANGARRVLSGGASTAPHGRAGP